MKIKLFTDAVKNRKQLEEKINSWLVENNNINVIEIKQTQNGGDYEYDQFICITFLYE